MRYTTPILALVLLLTACTRHIEYAVENGSSKELTEVRVVSDFDHRFVHGTLIPKAKSGFSGDEKMRKQNRLTLTWIDEAGIQRTAEAEISADELKDRRVRMLRITEAMTVEKLWFSEDQK